MKKNDKRRKSQVEESIKSIVIPNVVLFNRASGKKELLRDMIVEKLCVDLLEEECSSSGNKPFVWMLEDFKGCQNIEDFAYYLTKSYSNNGEFYHNYDYDFFNDETEEDDLHNYLNVAS